jgi:N-acyl-D-amino-acid deacylase
VIPKPVKVVQGVPLTIERPPGLAGKHVDGALKPTFYGLGWMVRPLRDQGQNLWHGGSLPGTNTLLVQRHDGITFAVLFNTRDIPGPKNPTALIDPLLHQAANRVEDWPEN